MVAGKERKDQASPQFTEVAGNIVAELTDAVCQHGVSALITLGQSQQCRRRNERDAIAAHPIKPGDDRDTESADRHEPMVCDLDARLRRQRQREDFTGSDGADVIRLWKFRDGESSIGKTDRRFGARTAVNSRNLRRNNLAAYRLTIISLSCLVAIPMGRSSGMPAHATSVVSRSP